MGWPCWRIKWMDDINEVARCVICGTTTPYPMKQSIHERLYYIEGAGQLCDHCHHKMYG